MTTLENLGQSRWNFPLAILSWRQFWQAEPKLQSALRTMVCTFALGTMIYNAKKTCRNSLILLYQVSSFDFWILTLLFSQNSQPKKLTFHTELDSEQLFHQTENERIHRECHYMMIIMMMQFFSYFVIIAYLHLSKILKNVQVPTLNHIFVWSWYF